MKEIKELLLKFNKLLFLETYRINIIKEVILRVVNLNIKSKEIQIKNNIIYLKIKPIYKSEILVKKRDILRELKELLPKKHPINIL